MDAHGLPVRLLVTKGTAADCSQAGALIEGLSANYLFADRAYDTNAILELASSQGMEPVIPPRKHRKVQRDYDTYLYRLRHLVENAVLHLKRWRALPHATPRMKPRSSPLPRSGASLSGSKSRDDTI